MTNGIMRVPNPTDLKVLKRIQSLRSDLRYYDVMSEVFKVPQLSADEYQTLMVEYTRLITQYPYESKVIAKARPVGDQLRTFGILTRHDFPVLDYRPATTLSHLKQWLDTVDGKYLVLATPYFEGCRIELVYQGGSLHKAITKGGGIMGLDITAQAYLIQGIPQQIDETERVSIRGVVTADINVLVGLDPKMAIAKALMAFDVNSTDLGLKDELVFIPDDVNIPGSTSNTKDLRSILLLWNFYLGDTFEFLANRKELGYLEEFVESVNESLTDCIFPINGLLFTIDDTGRKLELGYTSRYPEWSLLLERTKDDSKE